MEEVYKGYRIAIKATETGWRARVQQPRGPVAPIEAVATLAESEETCLERCRQAVDRYLRYLRGEAQ